ncbi:short-chain dehydrogenase [Candidatus Poribacteria bacterium]|nr:MAG: short-chain dehydrogenase [Candidatus Poribacteria bacterium]
MYNLNGKVALVTGAGGEHGIGRAIATRLAKEGADVIVNDVISDPYAYDSNDWEGVPSVVREIEGLGRQAVAILADVSDTDQVDALMSESIERFGHIDIFVSNAGSRPGPDRVPVVELEEQAWDTVHGVNLKGTFLCCRAVARHMISRGRGGKIITMSSMLGKQGSGRCAAYAASKFGVIGFTQALAQELAPHHINVNAICPGIIDTERVSYIAAALSSEDITGEEWRTSGRHAEAMRQRNSDVPLGRVGVGEDVANTAAFLASSESDYLTGLAINVSGGLTMS